MPESSDHCSGAESGAHNSATENSQQEDVVVDQQVPPADCDGKVESNNQTTIIPVAAATKASKFSSNEGVGVMDAESKNILHQLWQVAIPAIFSTLFLLASQIITSMYVGQRLGEADMAYMAVGISTFNVCALSLGLGLTAALDTLSSQAFGRDPESPELGEGLQRAYLVVGAVAAPSILFFLHSELILGYVFSPDLAAGAGVFLRNAPMYLLMIFVNSPLMSTMNAMRQTKLPLMACMVATATCVFLAHNFLYSLVSAVWVMCGAMAANTAVLVAFCLWHPELKGVRAAKWPIADNLFSVPHLKDYLKIGVPAMVAVCAEWWSFEALYWIAGRQGKHVVASFMVCVGLLSIVFAGSAGLSRAASVTVGNALGANNPDLARRSGRYALLSIVALNCTTGLILWTFGQHIFSLWTHDPKILKETHSVLPIIVVSNVADGMQYVFQGIYRGVGRPNEAAARVLLSLWAVGVTSAYLLSAPGWGGLGLFGLMGGCGIGLLVEVPLLYVNTKKWNWSALAEEASKSKEEQPCEESTSEEQITAGPVDCPSEEGNEMPQAATVAVSV